MNILNEKYIIQLLSFFVCIGFRGKVARVGGGQVHLHHDMPQQKVPKPPHALHIHTPIAHTQHLQARDREIKHSLPKVSYAALSLSFGVALGHWQYTHTTYRST